MHVAQASPHAETKHPGIPAQQMQRTGTRERACGIGTGQNLLAEHAHRETCGPSQPCNPSGAPPSHAGPHAQQTGTHTVKRGAGRARETHLDFDVVSLQRAMSGPISMDEPTCGMAAGAELSQDGSAWRWWSVIEWVCAPLLMLRCSRAVPRKASTTQKGGGANGLADLPSRKMSVLAAERAGRRLLQSAPKRPPGRLR